MKSIIKNIFISAVACVLFSCSDELVVNKPVGIGTLDLDEGVTFDLLFPEMGGSVQSRALGDGEKDLSNLHYFLFVFDGANLSQTMHIYPNEVTEADNLLGDTHGRTNGHVRFTTLLPQTEDKAVIHIVALNDESGEFAKTVQRMGFAPEDIAIPSLSVSGGQDAFWQRIELGTPIKKTITTKNDEGEDVVLVEGTEALLEPSFADPIPLVRNYAKVEVINAVPETNLMKFEVLGWTIVNQRNGASVAPNYTLPGNPDVLFPAAGDWLDDKDGSTTTQCAYDKLIAQGYNGVTLTSAPVVNSIDDVNGWTDAQWAATKDQPLYLYEQKYSTIYPQYLIVKGRYTSKVGSGLSYDKYYKLMLADRDTQTGLVTEYNILRNISYTVTIRSVSSAEAGYGSALEAGSAPASNNISGDVVTKDMFNVTDGIDMLYVNQINFIVTKPNWTIDFQYRYLTDLQGNMAQNDKLVQYAWPGLGLPWNSDTAWSNDAPSNDHAGDIRANNVVKDWSNPATIKDANNQNWSQIFIKTQDPTDELQQFSFYVFSQPGDQLPTPDPNGTLGLSRKINIILRNPWDYLQAAVYPGEWANDKAFPDYNPDTDENGNPYVGPEQGAPLTLFLELPAGLPEAMFPLSFTVESDRQNIENTGAGNAVVESGSSLFEGVAESRLKYTKTITWLDYAPDRENSTAESRVIRMRFKTTTNISSLVGNNYLTTLRIYNDYFNMTDVTFVRDQDKNVDKPSYIIRTDETTEVWTEGDYRAVWDFSSADWDDVETGFGGNNNYTSPAKVGYNDGVENQKKVTTKVTTNVYKIVDGVESLIETSSTTNVEYVIVNCTLTAADNTGTANYQFTVGKENDGKVRYFQCHRTNNYFKLDISDPLLNNMTLEMTAANNNATGNPVVTNNNRSALTISPNSVTVTNKGVYTFTITPTTNNNSARSASFASNNNNYVINFYKFELTGTINDYTSNTRTISTEVMTN